MLVISEAISLFIQPVALAVRLTASITAGHLLIHLIRETTLVLISTSTFMALITFIILALLTILEFTVAIIQAYVFTLLPHSYPWIRQVLATNRHSHLKPPRSTTPQHSYAIGLWCIHYLSPSQPYRRKFRPRCLFYTPTSITVLQSPIYDLRSSLRINFLRSHRIPRTTCNYWFYFPCCLFPTPIKIPLHIQQPLRLRSCCLILTFCRCCMTISLRIYLLMRLIVFSVLISTTDFQSASFGTLKKNNKPNADLMNKHNTSLITRTYHLLTSSTKHA
ncbi:hypothetical protein EI555_010203 [Monodon monoceros]|uniref:ATP synthase F(0) complex subunit a n=1 Tax=Monodon monoceros TaxID=40151 RepID=A0A4U1FDD7_MONMO|nr:hypothetical protein EI555_010203 [Monodon monoceros]